MRTVWEWECTDSQLHDRERRETRLVRLLRESEDCTAERPGINQERPSSPIFRVLYSSQSYNSNHLSIQTITTHPNPLIPLPVPFRAFLPWSPPPL
jgi:hypothetical protein